jgi:hypothetical protein
MDTVVFQAMHWFMQYSITIINNCGDYQQHVEYKDCKIEVARIRIMVAFEHYFKKDEVAYRIYSEGHKEIPRWFIVPSEEEQSSDKNNHGNTIEQQDHEPVMSEFLLLAHDVTGQMTANHGKNKGNNDKINLFDAGVEVVLQGKKLFYLNVEQSKEEKIVNETGKNKNSRNCQIKDL